MDSQLTWTNKMNIPTIELTKNYPTKGIEGIAIEAFYPVAKYTFAHYYTNSTAIKNFYIVYDDSEYFATCKVHSVVGNTFGKIKCIKSEPNPDRQSYLNKLLNKGK